MKEEGRRTTERSGDHWRRDREVVERFEGGREEEVYHYRVSFWNVAGSLNKDREFLRGLMDWDMIGLDRNMVGKQVLGKSKGVVDKRV